MWLRSELKERAKEVLKLNYWKLVLVSMIMNFVSGGGGGGGSTASYNSTGSSYGGSSYSNTAADPKAAFLAAITFISAFIVIFIVIFIIAMAVSIFVFYPLIIGCSRFFLECRNNSAAIGDVAFAFSHSYLNIVKIMFLRNLYIFLWSLLLLIPGYIKAYEYRMIPYILAENPSMSSKEVFALSKQMMSGEKWKAFVLDLSFVGWNILGVLTCCILLIFYVNPYYQMTCAELYAVLKQKVGNAPFGSDSSVIKPNPSDVSVQETYYENPYL